MKMWALKRQAVGLTIFALLTIGAVGYVVYAFYPTGTCTDGRQNGTETGVDCGGRCKRICLDEAPKNPVEIWSQFFEVGKNRYDVGALVRNPNFATIARNVAYEFKLYDSAGVLLARKSGTTYLYPNEDTFIYEPGLTAVKEPATVFFGIESFVWRPYVESEKMELEVLSKRFLIDTNPKVMVTLANRSLFEEEKLELVALLEGRDGKTFAANRTFIDKIDGESQKIVTLLWPPSTFAEPANIRILYRRVLE